MSSPGLKDEEKNERPFQPKIPLTSRGTAEESKPKVSQVEIRSLQEKIEDAKKGSKAVKKEEELAKNMPPAAWLLNIIAPMCQSVSSYCLHLHHQHQAL